MDTADAPPSSISVWERARTRLAAFVAELTTPRVALILIAIGVLLRAWHLLSGRSLWLDEAMIAASLSTRDWSGLLQPLDYWQVAPLGWLFLEKAAFEFLGGAEFALRLPQFLAGVATILLAAEAARRVLRGPGWIVAAAAVALSPELVRFSAEAKPYAMDALASAVALFFAARYFHERASLGARDFAALLVAGVAAVALSFPSAFVLAGLGGALFLREALARRWIPAAGAAGVSAMWLAAFIVLQMATHQSHGANVEIMGTEWRRSFAPFPPTSAEDVKWYFKALFQLFEFVFGGSSLFPALVATAIGAFVLMRRAWLWGVVLLGPVALAFGASCFGLYPFEHRLLLFAAPMMLFLAAAGADAAVAMVRAPALATVIAAALILFGSASALWGAYTYYPAPFATEHIRPVLERIAALRQADDPIFVDRPALPAFRHYQSQTGFADVEVVEGRGGVLLSCVLENAETISQHPRIWVLYSHAQYVFDAPQDVVLRQFADAVGRRVETIESISVKAFLYEFDDESAARMTAIRGAMTLEPCGG